jgi:trans-2-enoyl-CoA reductase
MSSLMTDITYAWVISQLDCAPQQDNLNDVVKTIHWRYQATDGTYTADCYGSIGTGDADLTQEQVIAWLESSLDVEALQEGLAGQLASLANPPIVSPALPWQ